MYFPAILIDLYAEIILPTVYICDIIISDKFFIVDISIKKGS